MSEQTAKNKDTEIIAQFIEQDYQAAYSARILLEARNNLFDASQFAFSPEDDLCAIEENQAGNAVYYLMQKSGLARERVLDAVDSLWDGERNLLDTIDWLHACE